MPWVDIAEAAFTLGVSERTIRNWIKSGKLEARNSNGKREVHIPDSEEAQQGQGYADEEDSRGGPIDAQKRLEVALIECGRVKGTLASQERMMETLSANIATLNAKLQNSERILGRRTIWCLIVAFIGILGVFIIKGYDDRIITDRDKQHAGERERMRETHWAEVDGMKSEHKGELKDLNEKHMAEQSKLRLELGKEKSEALGKLKSEMTALHTREVEKLSAKIESLREELEAVKTAKITAEAKLEASQKGLETAELRLAEAERTRQDLEAQVVKLTSKK